MTDTWFGWDENVPPHGTRGMSAIETLYAAASDLSDSLHRRGDDTARRRLITFRPMIDHVYRCPDCWIRKGEVARLVAVPGGEREDRLKCRACGSGYAVRLGA